MDPGVVEIGLVQLSQSVKTTNVTHTLTDRQTDRQTGRQTDRQAGRQTDKQTDRRTDRQTDRQTDRRTDIQTDRHTDRQADRQTGRQTDRQTYRQPDRHGTLDAFPYEEALLPIGKKRPHYNLNTAHPAWSSPTSKLLLWLGYTRGTKYWL